MGGYEGGIEVHREKSEKINKLHSDFDMHFNIILRLTQATQSQHVHFVGLKKIEEDIAQQTTMTIMEMPSTQGPAKEEQQIDEELSIHDIS